MTKNELDRLMEKTFYGAFGSIIDATNKQNPNKELYWDTNSNCVKERKKSSTHSKAKAEAPFTKEELDRIFAAFR